MISFYEHALILMHKLNSMQSFYECIKCYAHFYQSNIGYHLKNKYSTPDIQNSKDDLFINYTMYPKFSLNHYKNYGMPQIIQYSSPIEIMTCNEYQIKQLLE
jgi:hypothetical protein